MATKIYLNNPIDGCKAVIVDDFAPVLSNPSMLEALKNARVEFVDDVLTITASSAIKYKGVVRSIRAAVYCDGRVKCLRRMGGEQNDFRAACFNWHNLPDMYKKLIEHKQKLNRNKK